MQDHVFRDLFTRNPLPMWLFDQGTLRFLEVNEAAVQKYGYTREEFLTMTLEDIRPPEDRERLREHLRTSTGAPSTSYRRSPGWRHVLKDGTIVFVDIYSYDFKHGERLVRLVMVHDMTELKAAAERLHEQSAYFRQLFENSPEAIVMLDQEDRVVDANQAFQSLFQYGLGELKGRLVNEVIVPEEHHHEATALSLTARGTGAAQRDTVRRRRDGKRIEVSALGYPITIDGQQVGVFAIYRDVTESKRIAAALAYHSTHDPLTGLINRHEFERRTREFLQRAQRSTRVHALLYMDLDQFKVINDGGGHEAGDHLLVEIADVIRQHLPEVDALARTGGDEFAAILTGCSIDEAERVAQGIVDAVRTHRFRWDERSYSVSVSVGVVALNRETQSLAALLSAADAACYTAKERGRGRVQVFRPEDQDLQRMKGELSWATRIMDALERDRFTLYYQKIIPVGRPGDGRGKYEVLLRMVDDDGSRILPSLFIPAAERYGLMPAIDRRVVSRVFAQMQRLGNPGGSAADLVCVNLSGVSLGEEGFAAFIRDQLKRCGLPPSQICFEITETSAIANLSRALTFIQEMRSLGCSIALDDFGSGMSSFNYLKSLAVDYLKIDGSFIREMPHNPLDCAMAEAISKIGQVKGIKTIAECVESEAALAMLGDLGVDYAQGHLIHHPEPWESRLH